MRITVVNQFYPPDVAPTIIYLSRLVAGLRNRGHAVDVLTSDVGYDGQRIRANAESYRDGVRRLGLPKRGRMGIGDRLTGYLCFVFKVWFCLVSGPRSHLIIALTTPPFLGWVVACAARFRSNRHAHWVMDMWPDALRAASGRLMD